jgi:hypothetical protein
MSEVMETPIVTTVDKLDDLAAVISALDDGRNDDAARIRLCARGHDLIAEMLGPQKHLVYDQTQDDQAHLNLSVVGYVSAEGHGHE